MRHLAVARALWAGYEPASSSSLPLVVPLARPWPFPAKLWEAASHLTRARDALARPPPPCPQSTVGDQHSLSQYPNAVIWKVDADRTVVLAT